MENREKYINTKWFNTAIRDIFTPEQFDLVIKPNILQYGLRFSHHSSIAPTGSISMAFGNNCSGGIEPTFSHSYIRNVIVPGKNTKVSEDVESYEYMLYKSIYGDIKVETLPDYFVTAKDISIQSHLAIQAAAQKYCDSSISKTINVDTDIDFEEFKNIYKEAYRLGCKGTTTFRFNPDIFTGVLVEKNDLDNTFYEFNTDTGETYKLKGSERVIYNGEEAMVATLYDALKEGYYGRDK
jgi:ribonucleoside-diphosphate reductase alpha chain